MVPTFSVLTLWKHWLILFIILQIFSHIQKLRPSSSSTGTCQIFQFSPSDEQCSGALTGRYPWLPALSVPASSGRVVTIVFIWAAALLWRRTWVFGAGIWDHAIWTVNLYGCVWFVEVGCHQRVAGTRTQRANEVKVRHTEGSPHKCVHDTPVNHSPRGASTVKHRWEMRDEQTGWTKQGRVSITKS